MMVGLAANIERGGVGRSSPDFRCPPYSVIQRRLGSPACHLAARDPSFRWDDGGGASAKVGRGVFRDRHEPSRDQFGYAERLFVRFFVGQGLGRAC